MEITIWCGNQHVVVRADERLLLSDAIRRAGLPHDRPCGGRGDCGKCRVRVQGQVSAATPRETALLGDDAGERLSCLTYAEGDCSVELPRESLSAITAGALPKLGSRALGKDLGFAADIGTTTVAVYLVDLCTGFLLASEAFKNPQQIYGADVISRVQAALEGRAAEQRRLIVAALDDALLRLCTRAMVDPVRVDAAVLTGNTAMLYLLTGENAEPLAGAPFVLKERFGRVVDVEKLGFNVLRCPAYLPPVLSAFVGADTACALLACGFEKSGDALMMDIGTNGEMALQRGGELFTCATAAGPAFEGAGITFGSVAQDGAIDRVWLDGMRTRCTVLGGGKPRGLCGSGLVDAAAAFLDAHLIDRSGRIDEENENYSDELDYYGEEAALRVGGTGVLLTQRDVHQLMLAKAAMRAGVECLLDAAGATAEQVPVFYVAGGFGAYLDLERAARIGLIPHSLVQQARPAGNAAGMGALRLLLDADAAAACEAVAASAKVVELAASSVFQEKYLQNLTFEV